MEKGYNSDIEVRGTKFHIQTEDWGSKNPQIVTHVFKNGIVIKSVKTPYSRFLSDLKRIDRDLIRLALKKQHQEILDQLNSGHL